MPISQTVKRLLLYTVMGGTGTLAHYAVLIGIMEAHPTAHPVAASSAGALAGAIINYFLNYKFTFKSQHPHTSALPRFLLIAGFGMAINAVTMAALTRFTGWNYIVNQLFSTALTLLVTFTSNSAWTFKESKDG